MEREGVGRVQRVPVQLLVASDPLRVGRAFFPHPLEICKRRRCTSSAPLPPASTPRHAYKQKEKGEGLEESRSPSPHPSVPGGAHASCSPPH